MINPHFTDSKLITKECKKCGLAFNAPKEVVICCDENAEKLRKEYQKSKMIVTPVEYKVLIKPDKIDDKSAGGLYLPDSTREREQYAVDRGEIIGHGEGFFEKLPGPVPKVGDKVIFNKYAGTLIQIDRKKFRLCNDKDICAIIKE